jgi:hypothetical protein
MTARGWLNMRWWEVKKQAKWRSRLLHYALAPAPKCNAGTHKKIVGTCTFSDDCDWAGEP